MLIVISPAKKLGNDAGTRASIFTTPDYLDKSQQLIKQLRDLSELDISELMHVSSKIAKLNFDRFEKWNKRFTPDNSRPAVLAFRGDVYTGLDADSFSAANFKFAQQHLRILSGLYGLLRPLDLMMPYRLEMGTKLQTSRGKNLYEFWGDEITLGLNRQLKKDKSGILVNLASNEYFRSVRPRLLEADIITPTFKEYKSDEYKVIGIYAKKARGLLSRFIIKNKLGDPGSIKDFSEAGYGFNSKLSKGNDWVFTRKTRQG